MEVPLTKIPNRVIENLWREVHSTNVFRYLSFDLESGNAALNKKLFEISGINRRRINGELVYEFDDKDHFALILLKYS